MTADWDAATYHRIASPHEEWGARTLTRVERRGVAAALDAGCGSGRVTRLLLERLPGARVIGVDSSPAMLAQAGANLHSFGDRVTLIEGDLTSVSLPEPVDLVFSNATLHWIHDHGALFANLARNLRSGGRMEVECGGRGNLEGVFALACAVLDQPRFRAARLSGGDPESATYFAGPEETRDRLLAAGFAEAETWLRPAPAVLPDAASFKTYLETIVLRPHVALLPPELQDDFVAAVVTRDASQGAKRTIDYVRLDISARRD
jgi:trans-aconitate 2-methyltransferase